MKNVINAILFAVSSFMVQAGAFQNLGFDDAVTNNVEFYSPGQGLGSTGDLLPLWELYVGTNALQLAVLNLPMSGLGFARLVDSNNPPSGYILPVEGRFSIQLGASAIPVNLIQSGEIPADAQTIHFITYGNPVELEVNGSMLPLFMSPGPYDPRIDPLYQAMNVVADISAFAGQTVELKFVAVTDFAQNPEHGLDSISFSPLPIPEPTGPALICVGLLLFGLSRLCRKRVLKCRTQPLPCQSEAKCASASRVISEIGRETKFFVFLGMAWVDRETGWEPGGSRAISRWLSAATPPVTGSGRLSIPEGCQRPLRSLRDRILFTFAFRGWRSWLAQPPANGWHPRGMAEVDGRLRSFGHEATNPPIGWLI